MKGLPPFIPCVLASLLYSLSLLDIRTAGRCGPILPLHPKILHSWYVNIHIVGLHQLNENQFWIHRSKKPGEPQDTVESLVEKKTMIYLVNSDFMRSQRHV